MPIETDFAELTLSDLNDGELERQFQDALGELAAVLEDGDEYERNKDGILTSSIELELVFTRKGDDAMLSLDTRARLKRPKRKRRGRSVFYKAGAFTMPRFKQTSLLEGLESKAETVRTIRPASTKE